MDTLAPVIETMDTIEYCALSEIDLTTLQYSDTTMSTGLNIHFLDEALDTIHLTSNYTVLNDESIFLLAETLNGCRDTAEIRIDFKELPTATMSSVIDTSCGPNQFEVQFNGPSNANLVYQLNDELPISIDLNDVGIATELFDVTSANTPIKIHLLQITDESCTVDKCKE